MGIWRYGWLVTRLVMRTTGEMGDVEEGVGIQHGIIADGAGARDIKAWRMA